CCDGAKIIVADMTGGGYGVVDGGRCGTKPNLCAAPGRLHIEHRLTECGIRGELGGTRTGPSGIEQAEIVHESVPLIGVRHNDTRPNQRAGIERETYGFG